MPKKVLIALPPGLLSLIDEIAKLEFRTRSDLIREALRRYSDHFKAKTVDMIACENNGFKPTIKEEIAA